MVSKKILTAALLGSLASVAQAPKNIPSKVVVPNVKRLNKSNLAAVVNTVRNPKTTKVKTTKVKTVVTNKKSKQSKLNRRNELVAHEQIQALKGLSKSNMQKLHKLSKEPLFDVFGLLTPDAKKVIGRFAKRVSANSDKIQAAYIRQVAVYGDEPVDYNSVLRLLNISGKVSGLDNMIENLNDLRVKTTHKTLPHRMRQQIHDVLKTHDHGLVGMAMDYVGPVPYYLLTVYRQLLEDSNTKVVTIMASVCLQMVASGYLLQKLRQLLKKFKVRNRVLLPKLVRMYFSLCVSAYKLFNELNEAKNKSKRTKVVYAMAAIVGALSFSDVYVGLNAFMYAPVVLNMQPGYYGAAIFTKMLREIDPEMIGSVYGVNALKHAIK